VKSLAIIPARGGSKRIPRKNIRPFLGRPIIGWSIESAVESGLFDTVMVSTDDGEIAEIAIAAGADVPFLRSPETSNDHAGLIEVLAEVVAAFRAQGQEFDLVCCLLPTAPLVTPKRLAEGRALLSSDGFDAVFPVVRFGYPIQRALHRDQTGGTRMIDPSSYAVRSQDLVPAYHDAGQFYWLKSRLCRIGTSIFAENAGSLLISELEAQDIDTEEDWRLCELKYRLLHPEGPSSRV
jgi:N-acylneuraminate cytidylyltransferase